MAIDRQSLASSQLSRLAMAGLTRNRAHRYSPAKQALMAQRAYQVAALRRSSVRLLPDQDAAEDFLKVCVRQQCEARADGPAEQAERALAMSACDDCIKR